MEVSEALLHPWEEDVKVLEVLFEERRGKRAADHPEEFRQFYKSIGGRRCGLTLLEQLAGCNFLLLIPVPQFLGTNSYVMIYSKVSVPGKPMSSFVREAGLFTCLSMPL